MTRPLAPGPRDDLPCLPDLLKPGLRLVFIGYNPGIESARRGHYYAFPGNVFWKQLNASGLLPRPAGPDDDHLLAAEAGVGFTDLCPRPTVRAGELTAPEIAEGARRLYADLQRCSPAIAVFSGRGIYQHFARHALGASRAVVAASGYGPQPALPMGTQPWVIPSSSGLASKWHQRRLELLVELARVLAGDRLSG